MFEFLDARIRVRPEALMTPEDGGHKWKRVGRADVQRKPFGLTVGCGFVPLLGCLLLRLGGARGFSHVRCRQGGDLEGPAALRRSYVKKGLRNCCCRGVRCHASRGVGENSGSVPRAAVWMPHNSYACRLYREPP